MNNITWDSITPVMISKIKIDEKKFYTPESYQDYQKGRFYRKRDQHNYWYFAGKSGDGAIMLYWVNGMYIGQYMDYPLIVAENLADIQGLFLALDFKLLRYEVEKRINQECYLNAIAARCTERLTHSDRDVLFINNNDPVLKVI